MPLETINTKICIMGAGPAGATTSLFLCKKGIHHTIVDAAVFPRDKVCGDGLDLKVLRVLKQLNPALVESILADENFVKAWGATIIISANEKHNFGLPPVDKSYPFFLLSKRAYFDNFLVSHIDRTYADLRQGTKVTNIVRVEDKWHITAQSAAGTVNILADLIVGADGDHSAVLRALGQRKISREHYSGALRQYWKGIKDLHPANHLEIYLPKSLPLAYFWIFPLPNSEANVGCGLASDLIAKHGVDLKKLFNRLITEDPALAHRFKDAEPLEKPVGWGLPLASQPKQVYGDGYLLTGDAASMVCPTTGEGIGPGMISGYIAAEYIERAVKENCFKAKMFFNYDREIYRRLQSDIKKYKLLRRLSPGLYNTLIKVFSQLGISKYYFRKNVRRWIETAAVKPIDIQF